MQFLKRYWRRLLFIITLIMVIAVTGFVAWAAIPSGELMPMAIRAMKSDDAVEVATQNWLVFSPIDEETTTGFIFYPGGRVQAEAYAPLAHALADEGYLAVIVPMPLHLAIFNIEGAQGVIDAYPQIEHWAISGYSLGGSMAIRFAYNHPDEIEGLVILAAYPESFADFSERDLVVTSLYGELDGLATVDKVESTAYLLPDNANIVKIAGGNHAQFGWYGAQAGDNEATISREDQQAQVISATLDVLEKISK